MRCHSTYKNKSGIAFIPASAYLIYSTVARHKEVSLPSKMEFQCGERLPAELKACHFLLFLSVFSTSRFYVRTYFHEFLWRFSVSVAGTWRNENAAKVRRIDKVQRGTSWRRDTNDTWLRNAVFIAKDMISTVWITFPRTRHFDQSDTVWRSSMNFVLLPGIPIPLRSVTLFLVFASFLMPRHFLIRSSWRFNRKDFWQCEGRCRSYSVLFTILCSPSSVPL